MSDRRWWQSAVVYQIYIRSFADGNGDGVGDLIGLRSRLPYLEWLGVDAIWITPFYPSPQADHGYDVADFRDVDPMFGTLADFDRMLEDAHRLGIRVIVDIVPNHTSDRHPWFVNARRSKDHPDREKYIFRDPKPDGSPPNNWGSVFGGPAWTLDEQSGQYFLHLFAPEQPDLNWRNPEVHADFERTLRFWMDRGVDGFRIDVAHGLYKDKALRDNPKPPYPQPGATAYQSLEQRYNWDQPEVHNVFRRWRQIAEEYPGDRVLIGEVFLFAPDKVAPYLRDDELHLAFNFLLFGAEWKAKRFRESIERCLKALSQMEATNTWVLSNHDFTRHVTRFGGGEAGIARAAAAALLMLGLPGTTFLYMGEELGLEEAVVPDDRREDPVFFRTRGAAKGRDGCRVPIPWEPEPPGFGFSADPWLPFPEEWGERSVERLRDDPESILHLYRKVIAIRKDLSSLNGTDFHWIEAGVNCVGFERRSADGRSLIFCNFSSKPRRISIPGSLIVASDDATHDGKTLRLPGNSAAWIAG